MVCHGSVQGHVSHASDLLDHESLCNAHVTSHHSNGPNWDSVPHHDGSQVCSSCAVGRTDFEAWILSSMRMIASGTHCCGPRGG
eukprot:s1673_g12.t1